MIKDLPQISARVIRDLDFYLPEGKSLVPENYDELNEESLIKLLKDKKRAEIYRRIADRRDQMFREVGESTDKSILTIAQEFGSFSYEQFQEGINIESKLSSIILEFRARASSKTVSPEEFEKALNLIQTNCQKLLDQKEKDEAASISSSMSNFISEVAKGVPERRRKLTDLFNSQIGKFQQEQKDRFSDIKRYGNDSVIGLVRTKVEQIKDGRLDVDAFDRSDLFTDEEVEEINLQGEKLGESIVERRRKLNVSSFEEVVYKETGMKNKGEFLDHVEKMSSDLMSDEAKKAIAHAIKEDFILPEEIEENQRSKRAAPALIFTAIGIAFILKMAASYLHHYAEQLPGEGIERKKSRLFNECVSFDMFGTPRYDFGCDFMMTLRWIDRLFKPPENKKQLLQEIAYSLEWMAFIIETSTLFGIMQPTLKMLGEIISGELAGLVCDKVITENLNDNGITCKIISSIVLFRKARQAFTKKINNNPK